MVCGLRSGIMAASAKLLSGHPSRTSSDDFGIQKSVRRSICKELSEANEVNLIDEEDMHVFDLEPMKDPLNLVVCNACKKPIKVSCYAIHAELCQSLTYAQDNTLKLEENKERKKPTRKDRRKRMPINNSNQATSVVGEQSRFDHVDTNNIALSESQLGSTLRATEQSHDPRVGIEKTFDNVVGNQIPSQLNEYSVEKKGSGLTIVPGPLATKIYYSQRNNRDRAAVSNMYYNTSFPNNYSFDEGILQEHDNVPSPVILR